MNKVILQGNVGRDPKVSYTGAGKAVVNFSLATSKYKKNEQTGQFDEMTTWHKLVAFGGNAEKLERVTKGTSLLVEGELQTRSYEKNGITHYVTEVVVFWCRVMKHGQGGGQQAQQPPQDQGGYQYQDGDCPY